MTVLGYALEYLKRDWKIFPVHTPIFYDDGTVGCSCPKGKSCPPKRIGKHPRTEHGVKDATNDEATIRRWFERQWPDANIGLACGDPSGIDVIDVDKKKGGIETWNTWAKSEGYSTKADLIQTSGGGGKHIIYRKVDAKLKNAVEFDTGLDLRTTGGYIILAPSLHESGGEYQWDCELEELPTPSECPKWLIGILPKHGDRQKTSSAADGSVLIPEGRRNTTLYENACSMREYGFSEEAIFAAIWDKNTKRCDPPLSEDEVKKIASQSAKYTAKQPYSRMTDEEVSAAEAQAQYQDSGYVSEPQTDDQSGMTNEPHTYTEEPSSSEDIPNYRNMQQLKAEVETLVKAHKQATDTQEPKAAPDTTDDSEAEAQADPPDTESDDSPDSDFEDASGRKGKNAEEAKTVSLDYQIQTHLLEATTDVSYWKRADFMVFCEWLKSEAVKIHFTQTWLNDWQKAINEESRVRKAAQKASQAQNTANAKLAAVVSEGEAGYIRRELVGETLADKPISSFLIKPKLRVWLDGKENLKVDFVTSTQTYPDVIVRRREWNTNDRFMDALPSVDLQWHGSVNDVQQVLAIVAGYELPIKQGTTQLGRQPNGLWVLPNGTAYNESGYIKDPDLVYLPLGGSGELDNKISISHDLDDSAYASFLEKLYTHLFAVNLPTVTVPIIGWFMATPFKPDFMGEYEGFPHLSLSGTRGAGKSTHSRLMWRLTGFKVGDAEKLFSCTETDFVMLKLLSSTTSIPIIFDEYKPYDMPPQRLKSLTRLLRKVYDGEKEFRGRPDQSTVEYSLSAPIAIAGEVALSEGALLERIIAVEMSPNDLTAEMRKAYQALRGLPLQAFMSRYIPFCLGTDFNSERHKAEILAADLLDDCDELPDRIRKNLTVMIFGFNQFIRFGIDQGILDETDDLTGVLAEAANAVRETLCGPDGVTKVALDYMLENLAVMAETGRLKHGQDYTIRENYGEPDIAIRFQSCLAEYRKFHRETQLDGEILDAKAYRRQLKENHERDGYITHTNTAVRFRGTNKKSVVISPELAEANGIDLSGFFGNEEL